MDSPLQLVWVLGLVAIAIALSAWQRLGLEGTIAMATGRAILQLAVLGYVLAAIYELNTPVLVAVFLGVLLIGTTLVTRNRISQKVPNLLLWVGGSLLSATTLTLLYTSLLVLQPPSWYAPQYWIPLVGIVLGNAMNGAAISGERLVTTLNTSPAEIETHLSLGATPQQATARYRRDAIKAGILPTLNLMLVLGLVTLPTFMTGQLLGGVTPLVAAAYQGVIVIVLMAATLMATLLVTTGICRQYFNTNAQLTLW